MSLLSITIFLLTVALSCSKGIENDVENSIVDEDFLNFAADSKIEDTFLDDDPYSANDTVDDNLSQVLTDLSSVPCCVTNYAKLNRADAKLVLNSQLSPAALCTKPNGDIVASLWRPNQKFVYLFDKHGWVKTKITLPHGTSHSAGCVFTDTKLFYADATRSRILQFSASGKYQKIFATGAKFLRLTARNNKLYSTLVNSKEIRVFDTNNRKLLKRFRTTSANARGLAFDPAGYLHVSTWGKTVEVFNQDCTKAWENSYTELSVADGIVIDSFYFTVIADRGRRQVLVYNHGAKLVKRITGFRQPLDVAIGHNCDCLLVADTGANAVYFL